jgi:hypothetical protein
MIRRLGIFVIVAAAGCAPATTPRPVATTEGVVTYDGEPVPTGIVTFLPLPEDGRPIVGGPIVKGRYSVVADAGLTIGTYRVEIRWGKPTGEKIKDPGYGVSPDVFAEGLPAKYNSESTLTGTFVAGTNSLDFHLTK